VTVETTEENLKVVRSDRIGGSIIRSQVYRRSAYLAAGLLVCANLGLSIYGGVNYWWRVPFWDMIGTLWDYLHLPFWQFLIKPENEHVLIAAKALHALDFDLFHATGGFLIVSIWTLAAASAWIIASAAQRGVLSERRRVLFWGFLGLSLVLLLWLANYENLLWPEQVHVYSSVFFFLLSARIFAKWSEYRPSLNEAAAAIGLACLSVLSFAYGAAGAVAMLIIILLQRTTWRLSLAAGFCLGASITIWLWLLHSFGAPFGAGGMSPLQSLTHLDAVGAYLIVFYSAPFQAMLDSVMDSGAVAAFSEFASILGLFTSGVILLSAWRRGIDSAASGFALSLITFGLASGLITALARFTANYPLSSRYFIIPVLFWIGLIMYGVTRPQFRPRRSRLALLGIALVALSLVAIWQIRWLRTQSGMPIAETGETEMALINGIDTQAYLGNISSNIPWTRFVLEELRSRDGSIFRQPIAHVIGRSSLAVFGSVTTGCLGDVNYEKPVAGMPEAVRIYGWAYDMQTRSHVRDIVFLGPDGLIRGIGRAMSRRDDVNEARPEIPDPLTGWQGFFRPNGVAVSQIDAYAVVKRGGHPALCKIVR
jgi:hypothetical protein